MTSKHLMIAVNWYGPYRDIDDARKVANYDWLHGLYLGIGKARYERTQSLQYIGIGGTLATRLSERHHKLSRIVRNREIWLGEIATAEPSGKRMKATPATLDYAEWLHARFLRLPLNDKKTKNLPSRSVTVLNRWFGCDYDTQRGKRPHRDWPDLIDFPSDGLAARAVWFGSPGRQTKFLAPDYARPTE
jgi:hypothetical protein